MLQKNLIVFLFFVGFTIQAQKISSDFRKKIIEVKKDTIQLDSVALNPQKFNVFNASKNKILVSDYTVDFSNAVLIINSKKYKNRPLITFTLDSRELEILNLRIQGKSFSEIGKIYSLTRARIEQIERIIGRKLNLPKYKGHEFREMWNVWNKKQSIIERIYITKKNKHTYYRERLGVIDTSTQKRYLRKVINHNE